LELSDFETLGKNHPRAARYTTHLSSRFDLPFSVIDFTLPFPVLLSSAEFSHISSGASWRSSWSLSCVRDKSYQFVSRTIRDCALGRIHRAFSIEITAITPNSDQWIVPVFEPPITIRDLGLAILGLVALPDASREDRLSHDRETHHTTSF
jgi:hypothetical protein